MIYTVTINPALDRAVDIERFLSDDTIRVASETYYAAGKGIDVSRVIKELDGRSVSLGFIGGYNGLHLEGLLINADVMTQFTKISNETRTNIILKEKSTGHQYVISAAGPKINAAEIGQFYNDLLNINDMNYMILSGSLPPGVTPNIYGQLILAGRKKGAFVFLDADGAALRDSINYLPTGIKPNIHELSRLVGKELNTESEILKTCDELHQKGIVYVLVSRGKEGLILSTEGKKIKAIAPPVNSQGSVGAGDSAVAGFILGHSQGKDLAACLRMACAAGAATAESPGTELCHKNAVDRLLPLVEIICM
jgi:6-phosphofructokinase 2